MLRWIFSTCLISIGAFAFVLVSTPPQPPSQPIRFSHKQHLDYFLDDGPDGHLASMISVHREGILQELDEEEDKELVDEMMEMVEGGNCTLCHGDFDENVGDMEKLGHCAECHRVFLEHDWEGREDERPCMGCHNTATRFPQASIPNTNTCAACHLPRLGNGREETVLLEFIEQQREIPWVRVYDYLPGEIVFSHERHVELGRVKCRECHGPVERAEGPLSLDVNLSMEECISCHEVFGADNDCLACHK